MSLTRPSSGWGPGSDNLLLTTVAGPPRTPGSEFRGRTGSQVVRSRRLHGRRGSSQTGVRTLGPLHPRGGAPKDSRHDGRDGVGERGSRRAPVQGDGTGKDHCGVTPVRPVASPFQSQEEKSVRTRRQTGSVQSNAPVTHRVPLPRTPPSPPSSRPLLP